jgi:hypothetical protein
VARALEARGATTLLAIPREQVSLARAIGVREWISLEPAPPLDLRARLAALVAEFDATDWVVDSFPEGIGGELAEPIATRARSVALLRLRRDAESPRFVQAVQRYHRCLDLEPHLEWLPQGLGVEALAAVTRDLGDAPPHPSAPESRSPDVLLVASETAHRAFLARLADRLALAGTSVTLRCPSDPSAADRLSSAGARVTPECPSDPSTADRSLGARELGARVVVGPAGYNLTYELVRTGAWHIALPVPRRYDDQRRRAEQVATTCSSPEAVERRVLGLLEHAGRRPAACPVWPIERLAENLLAAG